MLHTMPKPAAHPSPIGYPPLYNTVLQSGSRDVLLQVMALSGHNSKTDWQPLPASAAVRCQASNRLEDTHCHVYLLTHHITVACHSLSTPPLLAQAGDLPTAWCTNTGRQRPSSEAQNAPEHPVIATENHNRSAPWHTASHARDCVGGITQTQQISHDKSEHKPTLLHQASTKGRETIPSNHNSSK